MSEFLQVFFEKGYVKENKEIRQELGISVFPQDFLVLVGFQYALIENIIGNRVSIRLDRI